MNNVPNIFYFKDIQPGMVIHEYWQTSNNLKEHVRVSLCLSVELSRKNYTDGIATLLYFIMWAELFLPDDSGVQIWRDCQLDSSQIGGGTTKYKLFDHNGTLIAKDKYR